MSDKEQTSALHDENIHLNYMDFLSASCKKRWSFVDAIYGVMPIFGMVTRNSPNLPCAISERFKALALQIISTQVSDEINIARLITLAEQQHISQLEILLPYPLTEPQLEIIRQEYMRPVKLSQCDDTLSVRVNAFPH